MHSSALGMREGPYSGLPIMKYAGHKCVVARAARPLPSMHPVASLMICLQVSVPHRPHRTGLHAHAL